MLRQLAPVCLFVCLSARARFGRNVSVLFRVWRIARNYSCDRLLIMSKPAVPLRILCIHGYRQNGSSFREKTGALRKILKKQVELVYISASHQVPAIQNQSEFNTDHICCISKPSGLPSITFKLINLFYTLVSFVTLDHKSSHQGQFCEIEIFTSSES